MVQDHVVSRCSNRMTMARTRPAAPITAQASTVFGVVKHAWTDPSR